MHRSSLTGYLALTGAQIAVSVNVVTSKYLLQFMPMFTLLTVRFILSTLILGLLLKITRTGFTDKRHPLKKLTSQEWGLAILQGIFAAFLFNLFFVWGLQYTTASAAGIIGSTLPAMIALSAIWLLKERLTPPKILALLLAMAGILVINMDYFGSPSTTSYTYLGDFLIFLAMLPEAWYSIIGRKLASRMTPLGNAFIANLIGFITLLPCALFTSTLDFSVFTTWQSSFILLTALTSLLFFWAWAFGLTLISASTAAIFGGVMPIATALLAIFFLGEHLQWHDVAGMLLVIASIVVGTGGWHLFFHRAQRGRNTIEEA